MYLDLDRFKRENFKYKAFSMILLVILGIVFAPNISISQKDNSNKFVKQLAPEDIRSFDVLYAAETLMSEYDLVNVQSASHTNNRFSYISSVYKNNDGKEGSMKFFL